jgi:transglutaminase-like putative cysteine protease
MITSTMPLLTIHHKTEYRYTHPVAFGEHRIMLRPRDGHDLRVLSGRLEIVPEPMSLRWIHDVFGNSVAIATFDERAETLSIVSTATVEHNPAEEFALTADDPAYFYPFPYDDEEFPDLVQFITPQYGDPDGELSAWARNFLDAEGPTPTFNILSNMTHGIRNAFAYRKRHEHGTQHPLDTLQTKSGTCRDYALFMIEALRRLGIAARFVSGYLFIPGDRAQGYVGGLSAERRLDRVRSHQRHRRHPRSGAGRGGARSAPGHPAARHVSRFRRCVCRHGCQYQRGFGGRGSAGLKWKSK